MEILNWIIANKMAVGGAAIAAILGGGKAVDIVKALWSKFKGSAVNVTPGVDVSTEVKDQDAIRHLRSRASALKNAKLIAVIKEADSIFYDIHAGVEAK